MRVWALAVVFVLGSALGEEDSGLRVLRKLYDDCSEKPSPISCLKGKAITFFDRAARSDAIPVGDVVTLVREGSREDFGRALTENDVESVVKTSGDVALNEMLFDRVSRFFNSHSLRLSLPKVSSQEITRGYEEGPVLAGRRERRDLGDAKTLVLPGLAMRATNSFSLIMLSTEKRRRGKMKKMMSMMMMMAMMKKMIILPIAIIALFLLAGKAFIISKIALILALIITLKKVLASKMDDHHHEVPHGGHSGGGWDRRSLAYSHEPLAHDLAYRAYAKAQ